MESRGECAPPTHSTPPPSPLCAPYRMPSSRCLFPFTSSVPHLQGVKSAPANPPSPPQIIFDASGAVQAKSGLPVQDKDIKVGPYTRQGCIFGGRFDVGEGQQEQEARCRVTRAVQMLGCGEGDELPRPRCCSATCRLAPCPRPWEYQNPSFIWFDSQAYLRWRGQRGAVHRPSERRVRVMLVASPHPHPTEAQFQKGVARREGTEHPELPSLTLSANQPYDTGEEPTVCPAVHT